MSEQQSKFYAPLLSIFGGGLLAGMLGGLIGFLFALSWAAPESIGGGFSGFLWRLLAGVVTGGGSGFAVGTILAWHGGMMGSIIDRAEGAPAWGIVTGGMVGVSLGPVGCGALGLLFGNLAGGAALGLLVGPLCGVIAWEAGFWSADYFRGSRAMAQ